ncbi:hypothetical protein [Natrinema pallidum]|uniref:DUF5658 domain-containing protein n=1 Tax=Natrinema pallidum DSM 3751 TaxID=1227495 RepID=L9YGG3_9EURY|nr:hypothetical protein [Natrinema pallidum]ELY73215.1 hypothetical protein C487_17475 [Natrinema pallidum DSM 3751]
MSYANAGRRLTAIRRPSLEPACWLFAIALFGVGDLVTTIYFIVEAGAVETHPIGAVAIDQFGLWVLVPWKAAALGLFYGFYRVVPRPYALGVPIGLALLGAFTSTWNTLISTVGIPAV